ADHQAEADVLQSILLDAANQQRLTVPVCLVHYVARSQESVLIHDAMHEKLLAQDLYVQQNRPRSVLAVPIMRHGEMMGLLYLENNAAPRVFTESRLEVLHLLATQVAISIENARLYADMEERVAARTAELKALTLRDALTGVGNRKAFDERLEEEFARIGRNGQWLSLLMIDIDHFKRVNDTYGHQAGDDCLRRLGAALAAVPCRSSDFLARYGGEEFAFLLPHTDIDSAAMFAERVLEAARTVVLDADGVHHAVTVSIGAASAKGVVAGDAASLVATADRRLYAAKEQGRNRVVSRDPDHADGRSEEASWQGLA
ncbi:MAG TPA: sensor domain-containing diguanylate cyclase, partial [Noviherbaspirillum sp.]